MKYLDYCVYKMDFIRSLIPLDAKVLDIGCGDQDILGHQICFNLLESKGYVNLMGVDVNPTPDPNKIKGDIRDLPFYDQEFDYTYCLDVIEHILDFRQALSEVLRVTKRRALIIVPTTRYKWVRLILNFVRRRIGVNNPLFEGHYYEFFERELKRYIDDSWEVNFFNLYYPVPLHKFLYRLRIMTSGFYIIDRKS